MSRLREEGIAMHRSGWIAAALIAVTLTGCNKAEYAGAPPQSGPDAPAEVAAPAPSDAGVMTGGAPAKPGTAPDRDRQWMAYSHTMSLVMDSETVAPHFARARDACLQNATLNCILLSGSLNAGDENAQMPPSAQLVVSLPHDQIAAFQKALLSPLSGQSQSDIEVRQQSTQADNLTQQVTDIDRRTGQLTGYRDRLTALAERPGLKAEDLIPLEEKISELQSELDQLASSKANIVERVKREQLSIVFNARVTIGEAGRPLSRAWDSAFDLLGQSASTVLLLAVFLIPWIPVAVIIWLIVRWIRRNARRRREREAAAKAAAVSAAPAPDGV
jgi:hypothetical protein